MYVKRSFDLIISLEFYKKENGSSKERNNLTQSLHAIVFLLFYHYPFFR